ncbi:MAG: hypothetical protein ACU0CO_09975 [Shimia sp.]
MAVPFGAQDDAGPPSDASLFVAYRETVKAILMPRDAPHYLDQPRPQLVIHNLRAVEAELERRGVFVKLLDVLDADET